MQPHLDSVVWASDHLVPQPYRTRAIIHSFLGEAGAPVRPSDTPRSMCTTRAELTGAETLNQRQEGLIAGFSWGDCASWDTGVATEPFASA